MIPQSPITLRQIQGDLYKSPLFHDQDSESDENLGKICQVRHALDNKVRDIKVITEDDKECLQDMYHRVRAVLQHMPYVKSALYQELRSIRHICSKNRIPLGNPQLIPNADAVEMLNMNPLDRTTHLTNIHEVGRYGNFPITEDDPHWVSHFDSLDQMSQIEIYNSPNFSQTIVRGKSRNRHIHTLPYLYNQIGGRKVERDDYVNASLINFGNMAFIAAQAPFKTHKYDTVPDFLNMLKLGCNTIVTLCMPIENNKEKCTAWWSPGNLEEYLLKQPVVWGPGFTFTFRSIKILDVPNTTTNQTLVKRRYAHTYKKESRKVTQFMITEWPDGGLPDLEVLRALIERLLKHPIEGPLIVHCSAGVGRTGTFILAYKNYKEALERIREGIPPSEIKANLFYDTLVLRTQRMKMVGTREQYHCVQELLRKLGNTPPKE